MKQIRMLAQYYVDLMMKLGLVRFSMLLALALVVLAIVVKVQILQTWQKSVLMIKGLRSMGGLWHGLQKVRLCRLLKK